MFVSIKRLKAIFSLTQQSILISIKVILEVNVTYSSCCQTMLKLNANSPLFKLNTKNVAYVKSVIDQ